MPQLVEVARYGERDEEVTAGEHLRVALLDPGVELRVSALGTCAVTARVEVDLADVTVWAHAYVPPHRRGVTSRDEARRLVDVIGKPPAACERLESALKDRL